MCGGLGLCTVCSDGGFCAQRAGYGPDASLVMIIEPSSVSVLCKECSPVISDGRIKS